MVLELNRQLLFNSYITDMVNVSNKFEYVLFADDTNIVNKELYLIYAWLCTNKLSINLSKTNFILFSVN